MNHKVYTVKEMLKKTSLQNPKLYNRFGYGELAITKETESYYVLGLSSDGKGFCVIEPETVKVGKLKLRRCAYVWEDANQTYPDSYYYLRKYNDDYGKRKDETWEYIQIPEWNDSIYINLMGNGSCHSVDDIQIRWIDQPNMALMHLKFDTFETMDIDKYFIKKGKYAESKNYNSFWIDFYNSDEELGYIVVHFNRNALRLVFTTDKRIYESSYGRYENHETNRILLKETLSIKSKQAQKEFDYMIDAILNA